MNYLATLVLGTIIALAVGQTTAQNLSAQFNIVNTAIIALTSH